MRLPVRVSAWIGAKQKFPTWLGPPRSSSRIFQSVHPSAPELKSLIIERPYASPRLQRPYAVESKFAGVPSVNRSEEHTSELQSHVNLVCRLLLEKKKRKKLLLSQS